VPISFVSEALVISGVALDLVGAAVLSHAHNAESALELREEAGGDERALGEKDAIATHAQLLSEKRVGFLILAFGLSLYLTGLVLKTTEGVGVMAIVAVSVLALGLAAAVVWVKVGSRRVRKQTHKAARSEDTKEIPDQ
jgi:hypothetical protein